MEIERVLLSLKTFFEDLSAPYAIVGGLGLQAYGFGRATFDVDLVVAAEVQPRLIEFLEGLGYRTLYVSSGYSNHAHADPAMGRVDFVYVRGRTREQLFAACRRLPVIGELVLPVPRPEHLAAMKVQAMKNDPDRTFQELADIRYLLGLPETDGEQVRAQFERHGMLDRYDDLKKTL